MKAQSVSPELFGRDTQLAELQHWLEAVGAGRGGVVLVAGKELLNTLIKRGDLKPHSTGWRYRRGTALAVPGSLRHAIEGRTPRLSGSQTGCLTSRPSRGRCPL